MKSAAEGSYFGQLREANLEITRLRTALIHIHRITSAMLAEPWDEPTEDPLRSPAPAATQQQLPLGDGQSSRSDTRDKSPSSPRQA